MPREWCWKAKESQRQEPRDSNTTDVGREAGKEMQLERLRRVVSWRLKGKVFPQAGHWSAAFRFTVTEEDGHKR